MYNIIDKNSGQYMLGEDVFTRDEVFHYHRYYTRRYSAGTMFDNGQGTYDCCFVPVMKCDCCGEYNTLH